MLIGISGKKRTGKDTVARMLRASMPDDDVVFMAFADHLKSICSVAFDVPIQAYYDQDKKESWRGEFGTPREQMIKLADAIKREYGHNFFVDFVRHRISETWKEHPGIPIIVTDVRYPAEATMIRDLHGIIMHVDRNTGEHSDHSSEAGLVREPQDIVLDNNGSIDNLLNLVRFVYLHQIKKP
jgi:hypothetical protein